MDQLQAQIEQERADHRRRAGLPAMKPRRPAQQRVKAERKEPVQKMGEAVAKAAEAAREVYGAFRTLDSNKGLPLADLRFANKLVSKQVDALLALNAARLKVPKPKEARKMGLLATAGYRNLISMRDSPATRQEILGRLISAYGTSAIALAVRAGRRLPQKNPATAATLREIYDADLAWIATQPFTADPHADEKVAVQQQRTQQKKQQNEERRRALGKGQRQRRPRPAVVALGAGLPPIPVAGGLPPLPAFAALTGGLRRKRQSETLTLSSFDSDSGSESDS